MLALHYQEYGDKSAPLMLFLHGGGVSGWMWDNQIEYFTHYHCIVPDLPEHGLSNDAIKFSIRRSAEELIQFLTDKACGKKVIVIGFSLGSQVVEYWKKTCRLEYLKVLEEQAQECWLL